MIIHLAEKRCRSMKAPFPFKLLLLSLAVTAFGGRAAYGERGTALAGYPQAQGKAHNELYASDFEAAPASQCFDACESEAPCSRFYAGAEYRYIRTHFSEGLAFATTTDTLTATGLDRRVDATELDFDYRS